MFKFHLRQSLTYNLPPKLYDEVRPLELQKRSQKKQRIFPEKEPPPTVRVTSPHFEYKHSQPLGQKEAR